MGTMSSLQLPNSDVATLPIPEGWRWAALNELVTFSSGGTPPKKDPQLWTGTVPWVSPKDLKRPFLTDVSDHITSEAATRYSRVVPAGTLFVVVRGMILARDLPMALARTPMAFNQDLKALVPGLGISPDYLLYAMMSRKDSMVREIGTSAHGTRRIGSASLEAMQVPVPPLAEQKGIARVLSAIREAIETEERRIELLESLRAAALDRAFREGFGGEGLRTTELGDLPSSWTTAPLGSLLRRCQYGLSIRGESSGATPILRMNCQQDGEVVLRDLQYVTLPPAELKAFTLDDEDLLFNRTNSIDLVGRTAIYRAQRAAVFASYLIRLQTDRTVLLPQFLNAYMSLSSTQQQLRDLATRGVGQSNISAGKLRTMLIPLPSLVDQEEIAQLRETLSARLQASSRRQGALRALFESTLNQLMTGQLRVTDRMNSPEIDHE